MENTQATPDRLRTRTTTYSGRKRRNRTVASYAEPGSSSASEDSVQSDFDAKELENEGIVTTPKKTAGKKTTDGKGSKTVEVRLVGPSPVKRDTELEVSPSAKQDHQDASSITSLREVALNVGESPTTSKTPVSATKKGDDSPVDAKKAAPRGRKKAAVSADAQPKPVSTVESALLESPEADKADSVSVVVKKTKARRKAKSVIGDDFDDAASVADSTISTSRIRRNENERIEYFKNQPECTSLEPHSVVCSKCNKSVSLGKRQTYTVRPWEIHRARCDAIPGPIVPATPAPIAEKPMSARSEVPITPISATLKAAVSTPSSARRLTEAERKEFLQSDKQVKQLEESRVLCARCDQWIALSNSNTYITSNWTKHKLRCSEAMPSNRVAAAKRKLLLVNDNQVQKFTAKTVLCKNCAVTIDLTGDGDFNLTAWEAHKLECLKSILFPSRVSLPRPLSASASTTSFALDSTPGASGSKRFREEDDNVAAEEERPAVRPRTISYLPPQVEPPNSLLGWFKLPFQSFVRGFKESLRDKS